jgi:hypothetical protein
MKELKKKTKVQETGQITEVKKVLKAPKPPGMQPKPKKAD